MSFKNLIQYILTLKVHSLSNCQGLKTKQKKRQTKMATLRCFQCFSSSPMGLYSLPREQPRDKNQYFNFIGDKQD